MIASSVSVKPSKYLPTGCEVVLRRREGQIRVKKEDEGTEYFIVDEHGRIRRSAQFAVGKL
jgi:hypothetical protein